MAIRFATAGDMLDTTAGAPVNTATTFVAWVYMTSSTANNQTMIRIRTAANALATEFGTRVDGLTIRMNSTGNTVNGSYVFTPGTWSKVACTIAATSGTMYGSDAGSSTITSNTGTLTAATAARFSIGGRGNADTTGRWDGRIAAVKMYNRVLSLDEIRTEWGQILPVNTEDLFAAYSLDSGHNTGVLDLSGNGYMLGQGSTLTEDGPPIPRQRIVIRPFLYATPSGASVSGTAAAVLGGLSAAGSGTRATTGSATAVFGGLAAPAAAVRTIGGSSVAAFGALTATATATPTVSGIGAAALGPLGAAAIAIRTGIAAAAADLGPFTATADVADSVTAVASADFGSLHASAVVPTSSRGSIHLFTRRAADITVGARRRGPAMRLS